MKRLIGISVFATIFAVLGIISSAWADGCPLRTYCCVTVESSDSGINWGDGDTTLDEALIGANFRFSCGTKTLRYIWLDNPDYEVENTEDVPANRVITGLKWDGSTWNDRTFVYSVNITGDNVALRYVSITDGALFIDIDAINDERILIEHVTFAPGTSIDTLSSNLYYLEIMYNLFEYNDTDNPSRLIIGANNVGPGMNGSYYKLTALVHHNKFEGFDWATGSSYQIHMGTKSRVAFYNNIVRDWDNTTASNYGVYVTGSAGYLTEVYSEQNAFEPADNDSEPYYGLGHATGSYSGVNSVDDNLECPPDYPYTCSSSMGCSDEVDGDPCYIVIDENVAGSVFDPDDAYPSFSPTPGFHSGLSPYGDYGLVNNNAGNY